MQMFDCVSSTLHTGESHTEKVELWNPVNLELDCTWTTENKRPNITGYWTKDGVKIDNSTVLVQLENEQYNLKQM